MYHWRGRSMAADRSAGRNDGSLLAQPGRIARQFDTDGEDDAVGTVRDLHPAYHRDPRFPGSSGYGDAHRPVENSPQPKC
jgi:hypothetical protein